MFASTYTPPITGVKQAPGTIADPEMQSAANAFEKMYPGIKINFVPGAREFGTPTWYVSEAAAGNLPDVTWVPGYYVNVTLPVGLFQDLTPAFNKPNPFIPGNTKWISTMNQVALRADTVPGNTPGTSGIYVVNGDWGGIGFYYNKNLFREAGITAPPDDVEPAPGRLRTDRRALGLKARLRRGGDRTVHVQLAGPHSRGKLPGSKQDANDIQDARTLCCGLSVVFLRQRWRLVKPGKEPGDNRLVPIGQGADGHLGPQGRRRPLHQRCLD